MKTTNKFNGLIATYRDGASSDAERIASSKSGSKIIQKELGCKDWVANKIFYLLSDGFLYVNSAMVDIVVHYCDESKDIDVVSVISENLSKLGLKHTIEEKYRFGAGLRSWAQKINLD